MVSKEEVDADLPDEITSECSKFGQVVKGKRFQKKIKNFKKNQKKVLKTKINKSSNM